MDLIDGNVYQHTGDLGRLRTGKNLDKAENCLNNNLFVVGVLGNNRVQHWQGFFEVILVFLKTNETLVLGFCNAFF